MHFGIVMDEHGNRRSMLLEVLEDFSRNNREPHRMSSIDRAIALAESYAVVYGFMRESDPSPLSLVAHSDVECIDIGKKRVKNCIRFFNLLHLFFFNCNGFRFGF